MIRTRMQLTPARRFRVGVKSFGFTLIELMVSMAVFLVIGGTAMSLFSQHAKLFNDQQGTVGLNISLRNALSQIENDTVQAGNGFYGSLSTANTPVGITITNNAGAFDSFYIIQAGTPIGVPLDPATACPLSTVLGSATLVPPGGITTGNFPVGTVVLFMNGAGNQMTVATIKTATAVGAKINITYNGTNADGTNGSGNDPFGLTAVPTLATDPDQLTSSFCPANGDYVVPLTWVQYSVDAQNRLLRTNSGQPLNPDFISDQIIGFKVGAATFQSTGGTTSSPAYSFSAASAPPLGYSSKFSLIRSVRVSIIGRTPPNKYSGNNFRNSFDGQNYKIESLSLVINPRNLSMND